MSSDGRPPEQIYDQTLIPRKLNSLSKEANLIENYTEDSAKGASYDFRAGDIVVVARPGEEEHDHISLKDNEKITIKPGIAYTFYSREAVNLPTNVQGRLSLKFALAAKKLFYSGGVVDPGYEGHLFFTLFNLSSSEYEIEYEDKLVTGVFKKIPETQKSYDRDRMDSLPSKMLPESPDFKGEIRNNEQMNSLLTTHESEISDLDAELDKLDSKIQEVRTRMKDIDSQMDNLVRAGLGAALAGIFAGLTFRAWGLIF